MLWSRRSTFLLKNLLCPITQNGFCRRNYQNRKPQAIYPTKFAFDVWENMLAFVVAIFETFVRIYSVILPCLEPFFPSAHNQIIYARTGTSHFINFTNTLFIYIRNGSFLLRKISFEHSKMKIFPCYFNFVVKHVCWLYLLESSQLFVQIFPIIVLYCIYFWNVKIWRCVTTISTKMWWVYLSE